MSRNIFLIVIVFLFLFSGSVMAGPNMKEGKWEITTTMKMQMPGMPFNMPPRTTKHTQCITKENMLPETKQNSEEECKMKNRKIKGNTITWVIECKGPEGTTRGEGKITYKGDTFKGIMKMKMEGGEMSGMELVHHMNGRWIGDCQ